MSETTLRDAIEERLTTIDERLSTYRSDSEISRFNESDSTGWTPVSPDMLTVIKEAKRVSDLTAGAFDISIAPASRLWGFGPHARRGTAPPSDAQLQALKARIGFGLIEIDGRRQALRKSTGEVEIDVSAVGEGFAVDELAHMLESSGCHSYLVEIGGDIRVRGTRSDGAAWAVAVERPELSPGSAQTILRLSSGAAATSGVYRNFIHTGTQRRPHILDARFLRPVEHDVLAVTVMAETCLEADALATALLIVGRADALRLAKENNIAALIVYGEEGAPRTTQSAAWRAALAAGGVRD
jgi:thiamine biosynthesis lipoprotein